MEGVRREHLGSAYMEEPRHNHRDSMEGMDVAAVGVRGRGRWEPRSTSGRRSWSLRPRMPPCGKTEGHQAPHVRWQPPQPRPVLAEAGRLGVDRY